MSWFKNVVFILLILGAIHSYGYSSLTIDCSGEKYTGVLSLLSNVGLENIQAVVVSHPFWHFEGKMDHTSMVFFWDTTLQMRGQQHPRAGTISELKTLADFLHKKKIKIYSRVDAFSQKKDFYLPWWSQADFTLDSINFYHLNIIDIDNSSALGKLSILFREMNSLPIDKWIIDIDNIPVEKKPDYANIAQRGLGGKCYIYSAMTNQMGGKPLIEAWDFWQLREGPFLTPIADMTEITNTRFPSVLHLIDSDTLTINNIAATFYMLSRGLKVVIPSSFVHHTGIARMLKVMDSEKEFNIHLVNKDTMLLFSDRQIISFHLNDQLAMYKIPAILKKPGSFNSVVGNSILYSDSTYNYFLLFPGSVYLWEIK